MKVSPEGGSPGFRPPVLTTARATQMPLFGGFTSLYLPVQFVCVESLVTAVVDMYPKVFRRGYRRELLILALSVVSYFLGLVMLTEVSDMDRLSDVDSAAQGEVPRL